MDKACPSQDQDSDVFQLHVDFFRKLGYSTTEVRCAIENLGLTAETNSVLREVLQNRDSKAPVSNAEMEDMAALHTAPIAGLKSPQRPQRDTPQESLEQGRDGELNPVVIDGSNVAMR